MGKLQDFLMSNNASNSVETEITIKGFPFPFKIHSITEGENKEIRRRCQRTDIDKRTRQKSVETDGNRYMNSLVIACTSEPNFNDAELQTRYGVMGAESLLDRVLSPGQYSELLMAVQEINGFDDDINDLVDEAKN